MSANNQILVKQHKGKFYVFDNINAESWDEPNKLPIKVAKGVFNNRDEAFDFALKLDEENGMFGEGTEYGVQFNRLCKDDAKVVLTNENE